MPSFQRAVKLAACIVVSLGCLVLIGWLLDIDLIKSLLPGQVRMKPTTALGFILAGTSLFLIAKPTNSIQCIWGRLCGLAAMLLGLFYLNVYWVGKDLNWLQNAEWELMSPLTAVAFTLISSALWLSTFGRQQETSTQAQWAEGLAIATLAIALQALIAYLYQVQPFIELIDHTQMAIHTAFGFLVLGVGILLLRPHYGWLHLVRANSAGGMLARRLLPAAITIPLVLGWLRIMTERLGLFRSDFGTSVVVALMITLLLGLIAWTAQQLHQVDVQRQTASDALHQFNDELEASIKRRTAPLRETVDRLQQSEERLNLAIEGAGMATWDMNWQTGEAVWSPQHFTLLGYDPDSVEKASLELWRSRVHPDDVERVLQSLDQALRDRSLFCPEYRIIRANDGRVRWLKVFGRFFYSQAGEPMRMLGILFDITESKQADEQLKQQAETLQRQADLLELADEAIIVRDAGGRVTYWNRGAEAMYGWTRDEARGIVTHTLLQTQLPSPVTNLDHTLLQQQRWQGELTHTGKMGQAIVVESRQVLIRDDAGMPSGFLEINYDITERKQTEVTLHTLNQELQRSLTESQTLLEVIPIGIGIAEDPQCRRIRTNRALDKQLGIPETGNASLTAPDDENSPNLKVYHRGRELTPDELPMQYAAARGVEVLGLELDVAREDGSELTLLAYATPLFDEVGQTRGSVAAFLDITDRKRAEAEVIQLNASLEQRVEERTIQLQQANEELEAFSYTVAHDLRAPLRGIQGYALALFEDYGEQLDEFAQGYIQQVFAGIDRMNALVEDLLAYSRLSREQISIASVSLSQVVREAEALIEQDLRDRRAQITITGDLPSVLGHRPTLVQMVSNLLSNAAKFVEPGVQPNLHIWAEPMENRVRLWVEDNGIGIEPQYRGQIFGVFERLHGRATYPGTGIGLAIVRKGAERLGGQVGVESNAGQGSQFWIELQATP